MTYDNTLALLKSCL